MKTKELEISVVLPAYNEEDNVEQAVTTALSVLEGLFSDYEVVIVDDGSTDRTGEKADRLARLQAGRVRVYHHRVNRGYGAALRTGLFNASGKLVFYTDADNQFDLRELADFLPLIKRYDIVVGYRQQRRDALIRLFLSRGYNLLIRYLFGLHLKDIDCSFKLFRQAVLKQLELESDDFFVDTELMVRARLGHFKIAQRPVKHLPRKRGTSSIRPGHIPATFLSVMRMWRKIFYPRAGDLTAARQKRLEAERLPCVFFPDG